MRYIESHVSQDLAKKMVFVGGPRQVGKTTLAKNIMDTRYANGRYLNWDFDDDRQDILNKKWSAENDLLIFDELHKYPRWKSWIKGIYDTSELECSYLVTGSARLDVYKKGGDSLVGRYHYWRLHPFSLDEIPEGISSKEAFNRLMTVGGFPEPFLDGDEREARRWRRERLDRVIREDIRDLESVRNIQSISLFLDLLRKRVGSLISFANLAGDLEISPKTAKSWIEILERMYLVFSIRPYTKSSPRAILKAPKVFFFNNGDVIGDEGVRFENLVATSLLKRLHFLEDREGYRYELCYVRDKEGREVDFLILKEGIVEELIEVKFSDDQISKSLLYYADRLKPKRATQIVANLKRSYSKGRLTVTDPIAYFSDNRFQQN
jgi:predicted AAA+ superfamily ATPase